MTKSLIAADGCSDSARIRPSARSPSATRAHPLARLRLSLTLLHPSPCVCICNLRKLACASSSLACAVCSSSGGLHLDHILPLAPEAPAPTGAPRLSLPSRHPLMRKYRLLRISFSPSSRIRLFLPFTASRPAAHEAKGARSRAPLRRDGSTKPLGTSGASEPANAILASRYRVCRRSRRSRRAVPISWRGRGKICCVRSCCWRARLAEDGTTALWPALDVRSSRRPSIACVV